ncbi:D-glucuronyl C5-epimerase family protein [Photobacterium kagoshimensis]|uniref:D-glucuronyl C5-epimerase family protein n=1 Tax=Photobacterium kagoshimensis TaxID=2910242 RepID=UPI003D13047F
MLNTIKKLKTLALQDDYWHGPQSRGQFYSKNEIRGYYNDLRKKVIIEPDSKLFRKTGNPQIIHPVTVCQVGLGALDKYIETGESQYLNIVESSCKWLEDNIVILPNGIKWTVGFPFPLFELESGFHSGLIQGQAISLFIRYSIYFNSNRYDYIIKGAYDFLLLPVSKGGCRIDETFIFEEYPTESPSIVLNGYISAIWGVYDYAKYSNKDEDWKCYTESCQELERLLPKFDSKLFSRYALKTNSLYYSNLASPYYHNEHIEQLSVMCDLYHSEIFSLHLESWIRKNHFMNRWLVIFIKGFTVTMQKLLGIR